MGRVTPQPATHGWHYDIHIYILTFYVEWANQSWPENISGTEKARMEPMVFLESTTLG